VRYAKAGFLIKNGNMNENGMGLIGVWLCWDCSLYTITILLLIPERAFQSTGQKVFFKIILNTLKTHTFYGFQKKARQNRPVPARMDIFRR